MLILVSGKQDPGYAMLLALATKLQQRGTHEQRATVFLDELFGDDEKWQEFRSSDQSDVEHTNNILDQIIDEISELGLGDFETDGLVHTIRQYKKNPSPPTPDYKASDEVAEMKPLPPGMFAKLGIQSMIDQLQESEEVDDSDEDFDNRYVEYKRQVDIVNNHNDALEEIASAIKRSPMMARQRSELDALVKSLYWNLPEEPTRSK